MASRRGPQGRPDPALWDEPETRAALEAHDFATVYRTLQRHGHSQAAIGRLTGQSQSHVCGIANGKLGVLGLAVIGRIAAALGIPPAYVGLRCCPCEHWQPDA